MNMTQSRAPRRALMVGMLACLGFMPAWGFRAESPPPGAAVEKSAAEAVVPPSAAKVQAAASVEGLEVRWDSGTGLPLSVAAPDLAGLQGRLGGKGLRAEGKGDFAKDAVAVADAVSLLYDIRDAAAELIARSVFEDRYGYRHVRLDQVYRGVRVFGGELIVHFDKAGRARRINGRFIPRIDLAISPRLSRDEAAAAVRVDQAALGLPLGVIAEGPDVVIYARDRSPTLAYQVLITSEPRDGVPGRWRYWIDADSGEILLRYNDVPTIAPPTLNGSPAAITGQRLPREGGATTNVTGWRENTGLYYLTSWDRRWQILNAGGSGMGVNWGVVIDGNTYAYRSNATWGVSDPVEMSASLHFDAIHRYYYDVHGWDSYDGVGSLAQVNVHYGGNYVNAFWDGAAMSIGDGDGVAADSLAVLDICAHEMTHGVDQYTADLVYSGESGAMNESFSDVFGALVEFYAQPDGRAAYPDAQAARSDWLCGEDSWLEDVALRDLRNPPRFQQPSRYQGTYWDPYEEVHQNDGVPNFFFYLLTEGGSGTNDGVIPYYVTGIGIPNAGDLAFLTLSSYLPSGATFLQAKDGWLGAAAEIRDATGQDWSVPVMTAWGAVGVGDSGLVQPGADVYLGGIAGVGPFNPTSFSYTVINPYTNAVNWTVDTSDPWVTVVPKTLNMAGLTYTNVTVVLNDLIYTLPEGIYTGQVSFANLTTGFGSATLRFMLKVVNPSECVSTAFEWIDPVANGHTPFTLTAYGVAGPFTMPFAVQTCLDAYTNFYVGAKGIVGLADASLYYPANTDIPTRGLPNGALYPLWDDLNPASSPEARVYVGYRGTSPTREVVVTWMNVAHAKDAKAKYSFQAILRESSIPDDNDVVFQYLDVAQTNLTYGSGRSATIGLEDAWGVIGFKHSVNGDRWVGNRQALLFSKHPPPDVDIPVGEIYLLKSSAVDIWFGIRFNELVTGLTADDMNFFSNVTGAQLEGVYGGGANYAVHLVFPPFAMGAIGMSVNADAVTDRGGHSNPAFGPFVFVLPAWGMAYEDSFEDGPGLWTRSVTNYEVVRADVWELGRPTYSRGPPSAYSGSDCWGTVLDGPVDESADTYTIAWLNSPPIQTGSRPVLSYAVWHSLRPDFSPSSEDIGNARAYVEVKGRNGWVEVATYNRDSGGWLVEAIELDEAQFANTTIEVRFWTYLCGGPGIYIDDMRVASVRPGGLWVVDHTEKPSPVLPGSTVDIDLLVYNSTTQVLRNVAALVSTPSRGVTVDPATAQISYGTVPPGYMVVNPVPVTLTIGGAGELDSPEVNMFHDAAAPVDQRWADQFTIRLAVPPGVLGTNQVLALTSLGVTDWLGAFLKGDGSAQSCIFQLIGAGANGTNDPPQPNGQPSGDDILLVGQGSGSTIGRIGEGPGVPANVGQFRKLFKHGLPAGSRLYVRAWDAASFAEAVAYGDSGLRQLSGAVSQTNDFGGWVVGTPISETNDVNHDSIPDAYCIRNSIDPRSPIVPLGAGMSYGATLGGSGTAVGSFRLPSRVVIKDAFVFVLDTGNNRIQVFDRLTGAFVSAYGSGGAAQGQFGQPYGLAVDPRPGVNRLVVADTGNQRVQTFLYDTAGLITNELMWGSSGSGTNQFRNPSGVGVSPSGLIYVADTGNGWDNGNSRIQVFNSAGVYQGTLVQYVRTDMPRGVSVATNSVVLVADTGDHRIRLYAPDGTPAGQVGGYGTNDAQFSSPRGVQTGLGGRGYVADTGNHRIQVFSRTGVHLATLGGPGLLPGFFNLPHDVMPTPDSSLMYVADTYNNRVQILDVILDQDGDGMNDLWEETHGLNSGVDDAFGDLDGDGLLNIGEYRLGLDPRLVDSNGDGLDDGSGVGVASNPLPNPLLPNQIVLRESGQESILRWPVVEGGVYTVEMTTNLVAMPWQPIGVVTSSFTGVFTWEDTVSPEGPQRYYRYKGVEP